MSARDIVNKIKPRLARIMLVVIVVLAAYALYARYTDRPWTRDGQVRADVVKIAPRVSGYLVQVAVKDNQFVRNGELLFQIDPSSYQLANADRDKAQANLGALGEANVRLRSAKVQLEQVKLKRNSRKISILFLA